MTKDKFTENMSVQAALQMHPDAGMVLAGFHLGGCTHCGINEIETLGQVCMSYGVPIDALLENLNSLLEDEVTP